MLQHKGPALPLEVHAVHRAGGFNCAESCPCGTDGSVCVVCLRVLYPADVTVAFRDIVTQMRETIGAQLETPMKFSGQVRVMTS